MTEKLTFAERWFRDGLLECGFAGSSAFIEADVTKSVELLRILKADGSQVKWSALFVKAAALALHRNPDLHQLVAGNRRLRTRQIDICLSVSSDRSITPVIVLENCAARDLEWLAAEIVRLTPIAREAERHLLSGLNRWGFLGFTAGLRRSVLRFLLKRLSYRRKVSGTFQVSSVSNIDGVAPFRFNTAGALGIGQVKHRPVAVDGAVLPRPTVILTCCFDHAIWNGADASRFLNSVKAILEEADYSMAME